MILYLTQSSKRGFPYKIIAWNESATASKQSLCLEMLWRNGIVSTFQRFKAAFKISCRLNTLPRRNCSSPCKWDFLKHFISVLPSSAHTVPFPFYYFRKYWRIICRSLKSPVLKGLLVQTMCPLQTPTTIWYLKWHRWACTRTILYWTDRARV